MRPAEVTRPAARRPNPPVRWAVHSPRGPTTPDNDDPSPGRSGRLLAAGLLILSAIILAAQIVSPFVALWRGVAG